MLPAQQTGVFLKNGNGRTSRSAGSDTQHLIDTHGAHGNGVILRQPSIGAEP